MVKVGTGTLAMRKFDGESTYWYNQEVIFDDTSPPPAVVNRIQGSGFRVQGLGFRV